MAREKNRKNKQPRRVEVPPGGRSPRAGGDPGGIYNSHPALSLRQLDFEGPFGWGEATKELFVDGLEYLKHLEALTWREVLVNAEKRNHPIEVTALCKDAQKRLQELRHDDVDELLSMRTTGGYRVWGIRVNATLFVLWCDPQHKVCPYVKKHT